MASKSLFHLLRVLDDRNTGLGREDVAASFNSPETRASIEDWIAEFLSPNTLLTQEEHVFAEEHPTKITQHDNVKRPLSDIDFEHAIRSLEASTSALEKQCHVMETQKQALLELKARNATPSEDHSRAERTRNITRDKAQIQFEIDEAASSVQSRLRESTKRTETTASSLPMSVERILDKDNRLLDSLQKVLPKLHSQQDNVATLAEVDKLCNAFTALEGQAIRATLDAIYRSNLSSTANGTSSAKQTSQRKELEEVRIELAELSSEIPSLLTLVSQTYYRHPISLSLQRAAEGSRTETARWSSYIALTLHYLTTRLEVIDERAQHVHTHRAALTAIEDSLTSLMASAITTGRVETSAEVSTAAQRNSGLKPLRLVQANLSEPTDPVAQMLALLDLKVPTTTSGSGVDVGKLASVLAQARSERSDRQAALSRSTEHTMTTQLDASFAKADADLTDLLAAVYIYSEYGTRRLEDGSVRVGVEDLEHRTRELGEKMQRLDLDRLSAEVKRRLAEVTGRAS